MNVRTVFSIAIAFFLALASGISAEELPNTSTLRKNAVLSEVGDFSYASGRMKLTATKKTNGDILLTVAKHRRTLFRTAATDTIHELKIPSGCQWFCTLDESERLWLYVGPTQDVTAGTRGAYCVVYMYGHVIDENGKTRFSIQNVTGTKDGVGVIGTQQWQGVPEMFLAELQQRLPAVPQVRSLLPEVSPTFSEQQIYQIVAANED